MPVTTLESTITKKTLDALNAIPGVLAKKRHASNFGQSDLDIYGCDNGRAFFIEMKRPGEEPSERQKKFMRDWIKAGAITGVATSPEEALALLGRQMPAPVPRKRRAAAG